MSYNVKDLSLEKIIKKIKEYSLLKSKGLLTEDKIEEFETLKKRYLEIVLNKKF
ncbi:hypothetical protein [Mycoplasma capricolum]|uniref:hypothetical protein n=1 Tax=Mycoplasma capricolum TaxID=2095 RepID=UPI0004D8D4B1|nr:hypothetical protein [Mycoplasma capricolum]KEY84631.1 hypothetical protein MCCP_2450 [Mycoplasma capricolum subsp. capripneumoniae 99108]WGD33184.1 hypothetical protein Mccp14020TZ_07020 [Mycoplasma capricolum subsp. capripneumoniae]CEA11058.1 hypothetical protein MCCPILRI181_00699 [Mycoplasma capricolum subsp. capripneumoniae]